LALVKLARRIQQLMAIVILAGIFTSTFLNMIVSPALYLMKYGRTEHPLPHVIICKEPSWRPQAIK